MKMLIETQIMENYGAHAWDGEGECPQRWKAKGGNTYYVEGIYGDELDFGPEIFAENEHKFVENTEYFNEYVLGWKMVADDYLTDFEIFMKEHVRAAAKLKEKIRNEA
jgi:hypothetical protein